MTEGTAVERTTERLPSPAETFRVQLDNMEDQFRAALPAHIPAERFARVVMTAVQNNPDLLSNKVERRSLWNAAMKAAQDGLLPDGRDGAIVTFGNQAQWMPMIGGIRKKVRNSGEIATWDVYVVHEHDQFDYELGDEPFIKHKPILDGEPGRVIAAYSVATLKSGEKSREVMSVAAIEKVRAVSRAKNNGPWVAWYEEMCRKTVARRHAKLLPMSTDLDDLIRRDDNLYDFDKARTDAENAPGRPRSLAGKLDLLAAGGAPAGQGEDEKEEIDRSTGEVIDHNDNREQTDTGNRPEPAGESAGKGADQSAAGVSPTTTATPPADEGKVVEIGAGGKKKAAATRTEKETPNTDAGHQSTGASESADAAGVDLQPEKGTTSAARLTAAELELLQHYNKALEGSMRNNGLQKASVEYWTANGGDIPDEGNPLGDAVTQIYGWHLERIAGKLGSAEIDNKVRGLLK